MYRCDDCRRIFEYADTVKEHHGLAEPPYEIINVCPYCKSTAFSEYNPDIPKYEVAERLLEAIKELHIFRKALEKLFGEEIESENLDDALGNITEFILEMFPDISIENSKLLYSLSSYEEIKTVLKALEG